MKSLPYQLVLAVLVAAGCQSQPDNIAPSDTSTFTISDNDDLGYVEYGPENGVPVFYFHGFPGSHQDIHLFKGAELADKYQLRLIAVDRPGYANSSSNPARSLIDWPDDIVQLADGLGLERFSILAYSGGGPFALACASEIPDRLEKVVIVSGMGPADAPEAKKGAAMLIPKAPKLILKGMSNMVVKKPEKLESNMRKGFPEVDKRILDIPGVQAAMNKTLKEAFSSGYKGALEDANIYKHEWGFELTEIHLPVHLWHGALDENVKIETARYLAEQLPDCKFLLNEKEGHLSLIYHHSDEIFSTFSR